jgi:hypothetical protein
MKPVYLAYASLVVMFLLGLWIWLDVALRLMWEISGTLTRLGTF